MIYLRCKPPQQRLLSFAVKANFSGKTCKLFLPPHNPLPPTPYLQCLPPRFLSPSTRVENPGLTLATPTASIISASRPRRSDDSLWALLLQHLLFFRLFILTLTTFLPIPSGDDRGIAMFSSRHFLRRENS